MEHKIITNISIFSEKHCDMQCQFYKGSNTCDLHGKTVRLTEDAHGCKRTRLCMECEEVWEKLINIISTHPPDDGEYCDTGEDMGWACRSECVKKAVERLREYLKA